MRLLGSSPVPPTNSRQIRAYDSAEALANGIYSVAFDLDSIPADSATLRLDLAIAGNDVTLRAPNPGTGGWVVLAINGGDTYCAGLGDALAAGCARTWRPASRSDAPRAARVRRPSHRRRRS